MTYSAGRVCLFIAWISFGIWIAWKSDQRAWKLIRLWNEEQGFTVLQIRRSLMPVFLTKPNSFIITTNVQTLHFVRVDDYNGRRQLYIRCGSWCWGLLTNEMRIFESVV